MSESFEEKTEEATPRKRDDAKRKGEIPRSQEVTTAAILLGSGLALKLGSAVIADATVRVFSYSTSSASAVPMTIPHATAGLQHIGLMVAVATAPVLVGLAVISLAIGAAQARGVLSAEALSPKWSRLSPLTNAKRIFGIRSIVELLKSLLKLVVVGTAMYTVFRKAWPDIMSLGQRPPLALLHSLADHSASLLFAAGLSYIALAGFDYAYQLWNFEKQLRMTREEVKREHKESEGDPLVKSRLRTLGRSLLRRQMFSDVPKADVVVTNPTHIAVALRYDASISPAPIVIALGQRKVAERIKQLARESGVPVIENKPLARALLATAKVGLPIPSDLYIAVAEVLAFVIRRRAAGATSWTGSELA